MKASTILLIMLAGTAFVSIHQNSTAQLLTTAVPFLRIEPDSRIAGMGNAGVAVSDNAGAIFWNPAALGFLTKNEVGLTHANWLPNFNADLFYEYAVGTYHVPEVGTFGAKIAFLNLGEQQRTGEGGEDLGTFTSYDIAIGTAVGIPVSENFSIGLGARFIYSNLAPQGLTVSGQEVRAGQSVGFDISGLYRTKQIQYGNRILGMRAGFNLSNVGPGITYSDAAQKDPLPTILRTGVAFTTTLDENGYNTLTIAGDASKLMAQKDTAGVAYTWFQALTQTWGSYSYNNGQEDVNLTLAQQFMYGAGFEYWYNKQFSLRGGYFYEHPNNGDRQYFTVGAGFRLSRYGIDFSYIAAKDSSPLANQMRFSVMANL